MAVIEASIYKAEGQRVEKGSIKTFSCNMATNGHSAGHAYALGQAGEQITEVDGSGHWLHSNVYAAGNLIASDDQTGTKGYVGRLEIRTADNFGITVTLNRHDGWLDELYVDYLDLEERGDRPQPLEWTELAHICTKM